MGRFRDAFAALTRRPVRIAPAASWNWRSGSTSSGYDGSKFRGALRSIYPSGIDLDTETLRARSRASYWDSTQARAILSRLVDSVVGTGLTLRSAPAWEMIGSTMPEDARRKLSDEIDVRWKLWADSHEPDAAGRRNLAELQGFAFLNELRDGDLSIVYRYSGDASRVSPLNIQFLDADQISTTFDSAIQSAVDARGNVLRDGLELTSSGAIVAIYVTDPDTRKTTRIPAHGPSGRRFVSMPALLDMPGQARGVGPLAIIVHELQKITDYTVAEIEAAVSNALIAGMVEPSGENDTRTDLGRALGGGPALRTTGAVSTGADTTGESVRIDRPGLWVGTLKAGEKLASFDTKRPNVNFGLFVSTVTKSLSASLSLPVEVLEMSFNANYSASRAALVMFWNVVERWRVHVVSQILGPLYEAWLREEVAAGRLPILVANGFGSDPIRTRAWLQADWVGDSMPSIDPLKEATADDVRLAQCSTSGERVALKYNRSDWWDNVKRRARELAAMPKGAAPKQEKPAPAQEPDENTEEGKPAKEGAA